MKKGIDCSKMEGTLGKSEIDTKFPAGKQVTIVQWKIFLKKIRNLAPKFRSLFLSSYLSL
jgi:hypothetical protein